MLEWAVTSSVLILVVVALRCFLTGKLSLRLPYGLWALVLIRLLVPASFGTTTVSVLNLVEKANIPSPVIGYLEGKRFPLSIPQPDPTLPLDEQQVQYAQNGEPWQVQTDAARDGSGTPLSLKTVLLGVWAVGALTLGLWLLWINVHFARKLRRSRRPLEGVGCPLPVYITGATQAPCLFGLVRPCIYVTKEAAADNTVLRHSLSHELTHCRHGDHIWAALRGLCLVLHWYNPLVWLAAALSQRDGELCCDEATVQRLGESERASYGRTLLAITCQGRDNPLLAATSITGSGIKERIRLLAKRPKMAAYTLTAVVLIAATAVGCTFTGAKSGNAISSDPGEDLTPAISRDMAEETIFNAYEDELALVETLSGQAIDPITPAVREAIAAAANQNLYNPSYKFSELMTALAYVSALSSAGENNPDIAVVVPYGAISGALIDNLPISAATASGSITLEISADFFPDLELGDSYSLSVPYSFAGPEGETELWNGLRATHHAACAVAFGTVMRAGDEYYLADLSGEIFVSRAGVAADGSLYIDTGAPNVTFTSFWEKKSDFEEDLYTQPELYLCGNTLPSASHWE